MTQPEEDSAAGTADVEPSSVIHVGDDHGNGECGDDEDANNHPTNTEVGSTCAVNRDMAGVAEDDDEEQDNEDNDPSKKKEEMETDHVGTENSADDKSSLDAHPKPKKRGMFNMFGFPNEKDNAKIKVEEKEGGGVGVDSRDHDEDKEKKAMHMNEGNNDNNTGSGEMEGDADTEDGEKTNNTEPVKKLTASSVRAKFWSSFVVNKMAKTATQSDEESNPQTESNNHTSAKNEEVQMETERDNDDNDGSKEEDAAEDATEDTPDDSAKEEKNKKSKRRQGSPSRLRFWGSRKTPPKEGSDLPVEKEQTSDGEEKEVDGTAEGNQEEEKDDPPNEEEDSHSLNAWVKAVKDRHEKLSEFEKERAKLFRSKWLALQAYVQVYDEVGSESLAEMQRLHDFVTGILTAQKRFSEIMQEKKHQLRLLKGGKSETIDTSGDSDKAVESTQANGKEELNAESSLSSRHQAPALDDLAGRWATASDEPPPSTGSDTIPTLPSSITPLLDALEVSNDVWESKFSSKAGQSGRGLVNVLKASWPIKIRSQKAELDKLCEEVFPSIVSKQSAVEDAWEKYEKAVEDVNQAVITHRKNRNSLVHMFSRSGKTHAEQQLALARLLAKNPDVWMAERSYYTAVRDLQVFWDQRIIGNDNPEVVQTTNQSVMNDDPADVNVDEVTTREQIDEIVSNMDEAETKSGDSRAVRLVLEEMAETESLRRVEIAECLKDWVAGQERVLAGSEAATGLAWMEMKRTDGICEEDGSPSDLPSYNNASQSKSKEIDGTSETKEGETPYHSTRVPSATEIQHRRVQVQQEVEKVLSEKWTEDLARDWIHGASRPEETLELMEEVFGLETYLESPHVVSAAVGEWWRVPTDRPSDTGYEVLDEDDGPQHHVALVIISSGPRMHIYNLNTDMVVLDLETPPHDALLELLSGNNFPAPTLSIPLAEAQVKMTNEVDVVEVSSSSSSASLVPRIRLLCPHLNNIY